MTRFINQQADATIQSLAFSRMGRQHYCFMHLPAHADSAALTAWLSRPEIGQEILSQTPEAGGTLLVMRGTANPEMFLETLGARGEYFTAEAAAKKPFTPWKWRGYLGMTGQGLQLISGLKNSHNRTEQAAVVGFAVSNLLANLMNIVFGAQKKTDPHQLLALKNRFNETLAPHLAEGEKPPDVNTTHLSDPGRDNPRQPWGDRAKAFMQRHSVSIGDIALRVIGSIFLVVPITHIKPAWQSWRSGGTLKEISTIAANHNHATLKAGLIMLFGKALSFCSKEPDPYNPMPQTMLGRIREKVTFPLSSVIEASAMGYMAHDRFTRKDKLTGKPAADLLGGTGSSIFVGGFAVRLFAPYGTREVNMPELIAHIGHGLAKLPPEKIPDMLARTSQQLAAHFANNEMDIATIYTQLANDLVQHHHLILKPTPMATASAHTHHGPTTSRPPHTLPATATHEGRVQEIVKHANMNRVA